MNAKLVGQKGAVAGKEFPLSRDEECIIGRVSDSNFQIEDDLVSREHCRIFFSQGYYVVEDLQSRNGTWVNGERVSATPLFHGDSIAVGRQELHFRLDEIAEETDRDLLRDVSSDKFSTEFKERAPERAAAQLGLKVGDKPGHRELAELERDLAAVCRIIDVVNREEALGNLFSRIMDHVMEVTEADRGYLFGGEQLGAPLTPQVIRQGPDLPEWLRNAFSRSIVRECYQSGYSILRADPLAQHSEPSQSIMRQHIQSLMCVPMRCEEGVVGVIYVDRLSAEKKFSRQDLRVLSAIANEAGIAVRRAQLTKQVETLFSEAVRTLVSIVEVKDRYTRTHSVRVTEVAVRIGELAGLTQVEMRNLQLAGQLHDVGKVGTPADVLKKPARLTDSEYEEVKRHPANSSRLVASIEGGEQIAQAVRHHHERWDGDGYPDGLAGEDIPLLARILALADAFDSMYAGRPYRQSLGEQQVLDEIEAHAEAQFDPNLAQEFVRAFRSDAGFREGIKAAYAEPAAPGESWPTASRQPRH